MKKLSHFTIMLSMFFALSLSFSACEKIETENDEKESTSTDIDSDDIDKNKDEEGDKGDGDDDKNNDDAGSTDNPGSDDNGGNDDSSDVNGDGDTPGNDGDNTEEPDDTGYHTGDFVSVSEFIKKDIKCEVWIVGRIVGDCTRSKKYAEFEEPFTLSQAVLIADDPNEKDINKVASICLTTNKSMRKILNLADNPGNKNLYVAVFGFKETYLGLPGIKKPCGYKFPVNIN